MKKLSFLLLAILCLCFSELHANGVAIVDASAGDYFRLMESEVIVDIKNQVAVVRTTQLFKNTGNTSVTPKYAYPIHETASATKLRWSVSNTWFTADLTPSPQDTTLPGSGNNNNNQTLRNYLGNAPLFFNIVHSIPPDSILKVELTYVELLPYFNNVVSLYVINDYTEIQPSSPVGLQTFQANIESQREIAFISMPLHPLATITTNTYEGSVSHSLSGNLANEDYSMNYSLNSNQLGLYSFSTYYSDGIACDSNGKGYFGLIVEPDPSDTAEVIEKDFILIIDRSGSMGGLKMTQAKQAASFIVSNMNAGDRFNLVAFDGSVTAYAAALVNFNVSTETSALNWINNLSAGGSTNIESAFIQAIPQFANANPDDAKIVIFITDGHPTSGETATQPLINTISGLINFYAPDISLYTFGIGANVNQQLLSQMATQNSGLAAFLLNNNLNTAISNFYLTIQSPVLLNTAMAMSPNALFEMYPTPLPNLYKGQQLVVLGRYDIPDSVNATFSGNAFGNPVSYNYNFVLTDTLQPDNSFLTKLWAQQKINHLMQQYYNAGSDASITGPIKDEVINTSSCYNVISPFTSFTGNVANPFGGPGGLVGMEEAENHPADQPVKLHPNPVNAFATIDLKGLVKPGDAVTIEIYDLHGKLIKTITLRMDQNASPLRLDLTDLHKGNYVLLVKGNHKLYRALMTKL